MNMFPAITKQERIDKLYRAFGQQGGTVHQLVKIIIKNETRTKSEAYDYIENLLELTSDEEFAIELKKISDYVGIVS